MHARTTERRRCRAALAAVLAFAATAAVPVGASAYDWQSGDVFVGLSSGQYNVYDNGGTLHETINQPVTGSLKYAVDCAFDRSGVLHTTAYTVPAIVRFLGPAPHSLLTDITAGLASYPESVSFARDGSFYVGHKFNPGSLQHRTGAGALIGSVMTPPTAASLIDLSADQRTMFYTSRDGTPPRVHRFDVASGTPLADFADPGGTDPAGDVKLLPPGDGSGGLILAQTGVIKRLDGNGHVVQQYDVAGEDSWFGIALDPDGRSFWAQTNDPGNVYRFNIASGAVDRGPLPAASAAYGICVKGTRLAALDNAAPSISVATPADGARFVQGQSVTGGYSCADDRFGTGVSSCSGTVAPGAALDTGSVGTKTFKVDAADNAGNSASVTRSYTVVARKSPGRILVSVSFRYAASNTSTRLTSFAVKNIPRGATLRVSCAPKKKGARCPAKRLVKKRARGTVKLKRFVGPKFKRGTVITVQVTKPGMVGAVKLVTIRKRNGPATATKCLPIGARKPTACR